MLSIMVDGNPTQWDDMLPFVMLAYNSSVYESTGVTPAIDIAAATVGRADWESGMGLECTHGTS
ncbi:hypothetical protein T12_6475 [Trichinella patagoniensis]|uniref:Uncharacterized protein n=1 Tax=Trichinella patagoniensis TaxID=990121 RepID=A0A0V0Z580_9BILA|nr:hypothetical protein T12_6475 [Trichinella patagoniensis]